MSWETMFADPKAVADGVGADRYFGPAEVVQLDDEGGKALVAMAGVEDPPSTWAEIALADPATLVPGRIALVVRVGDGPAYVIGVLGRGAAAPVGPKAQNRGGASASVIRVGQADRLEVRNERHELLFQYDEEKGQARLCVPSGDLDILVPNGDLTLASDQAVRLRGRTVDVAATTGIRLAVHDLTARLLTSFGLSQRGASVKTRNVRVEAVTADLAVKAGKLAGERLDTDVTVIRTRARRIETDAETVVERAGNVYRQVRGLLQTRAERVRDLISGTWHSRAKRADLRTKDVFKIDGDRIHLG
jgi:hypothetical protein